MATVEQVAKDALGKILVQGSEAPLNPDDYQDFIYHLNNYMTDLAAKGINLGYTEVDSLSDTVTIPNGALRAIGALMAVEMAPLFGATVSQEVAAIARSGIQTLRLLGQRIQTSKFPSTLPIGSGNDDGGGLSWRSKFYPEAEETILSESTGAIGVESST